MAMNPHGHSATIVMFPTAKRAAAVILGKQAKFAAEVAALRSQTIVNSDSWYHQEAIEEARPGRKN